MSRVWAAFAGQVRALANHNQTEHRPNPRQSIIMSNEHTTSLNSAFAPPPPPRVAHNRHQQQSLERDVPRRVATCREISVTPTIFVRSLTTSTGSFVSSGYPSESTRKDLKSKVVLFIKSFRFFL